MNINWATPKIDIFNLDYPPIINIFRQPSEPFSLDSSQALTPIVLGCSSAYEKQWAISIFLTRVTHLDVILLVKPTNQHTTRC